MTSGGGEADRDRFLDGVDIDGITRPAGVDGDASTGTAVTVDGTTPELVAGDGRTGAGVHGRGGTSDGRPSTSLSAGGDLSTVRDASGYLPLSNLASSLLDSASSLSRSSASSESLLFDSSVWCDPPAVMIFISPSNPLLMSPAFGGTAGALPLPMALSISFRNIPPIALSMRTIRIFGDRNNTHVNKHTSKNESTQSDPVPSRATSWA